MKGFIECPVRASGKSIGIRFSQIPGPDDLIL